MKKIIIESLIVLSIILVVLAVLENRYRFIPFGAVEFQQVLVDNRDDIEIIGFNNRKMVLYFNWIGEYLYYFDTNLD